MLEVVYCDFRNEVMYWLASRALRTHVQNQQVAFAFAKETGCGFEGVFHQGVRPKLLDPEMDIGGLFRRAALAFKFDAFGKCFAEFHWGVSWLGGRAHGRAWPRLIKI